MKAETIEFMNNTASLFMRVAKQAQASEEGPWATSNMSGLSLDDQKAKLFGSSRALRAASTFSSDDVTPWAQPYAAKLMPIAGPTRLTWAHGADKANAAHEADATPCKSDFGAEASLLQVVQGAIKVGRCRLTPA